MRDRVAPLRYGLSLLLFEQQRETLLPGGGLLPVTSTRNEIRDLDELGGDGAVWVVESKRRVQERRVGRPAQVVERVGARLPGRCGVRERNCTRRNDRRASGLEEIAPRKAFVSLLCQLSPLPGR